LPSFSAAASIVGFTADVVELAGARPVGAIRIGSELSASFGSLPTTVHPACVESLSADGVESVPIEGVESASVDGVSTAHTSRTHASVPQAPDGRTPSTDSGQKTPSCAPPSYAPPSFAPLSCAPPVRAPPIGEPPRCAPPGSSLFGTQPDAPSVNLLVG